MVFKKFPFLFYQCLSGKKAEANCDPTANAWCAYIDLMTMDIPKWNISNPSS